MPHRRFSGTGNGHSSRNFPRQRKRARLLPARRVKRLKRVGKEKEKGGKTHFSKAARSLVLLTFSPSAFQSRFQGRFAFSPSAFQSRLQGRFALFLARKVVSVLVRNGERRIRRLVRTPGETVFKTLSASLFFSRPMQKELRERAKPLRPRKKNGRGLKFVWRREREKGETAGSPLSAAKKNCGRFLKSPCRRKKSRLPVLYKAAPLPKCKLRL